ncbi:hypothetical protein N665_0051s0005 [Sinapis alba]|nr:hypothetical protein N665_0051s0005 [Sinapis alba]
MVSSNETSSSTKVTNMTTPEQRIILKKKSDPRKFVISCLIKGNEFPNALYDTGSSVSIIPRAMAEKLNLRVEPSTDSFVFVDCSRVYFVGICRDDLLQIQNVLVPIDFHVIDIQINWNSSQLLGRVFMAIVGAIYDMKTNRLCLSLIDPNDNYEIYKNKPALMKKSNDVELVATCFCNYEFNEEPDDGESIDTPPRASIDAFAVQQSVDNHPSSSIDTLTEEPINPMHMAVTPQPTSSTTKITKKKS